MALGTFCWTRMSPRFSVDAWGWRRATGSPKRSPWRLLVERQGMGGGQAAKGGRRIRSLGFVGDSCPLSPPWLSPICPQPTYPKKTTRTRFPGQRTKYCKVNRTKTTTERKEYKFVLILVHFRVADFVQFMSISVYILIFYI